jgi:hypothetical protein
MATAATPKRSFKRTVASTVEGRTPRFLLGSLALAMVISLVAGLAIGVKIGEHGKSSTKKVAVVKRTPTTKKRVVSKSPFARPPLKGVVARVTPKLVAIRRGPRARIPLVMGPRTKIETTTKAGPADIKAGSRVLFVLGLNTATTTPTTAAAAPTTGTGAPTPTTAAKPALHAKSVLIISGIGPRIGSVVSSVTPDSMTFKAANGKTVTISTFGAHISKTIPVTKALLKAGQHVLVRSRLGPVPKKTKKVKGKKARPVKRSRLALEIVILPTPSAFA